MKPNQEHIQRYIKNADTFCKKINDPKKHDFMYNVAMVYKKFGSVIGIGKSRRIAKKYSKKL